MSAADLSDLEAARGRLAEIDSLPLAQCEPRAMEAHLDDLLAHTQDLRGFFN